MSHKRLRYRTATIVLSLTGAVGTAYAWDDSNECQSLPGQSALKAALAAATAIEASGLAAG